MWWQLAGAGAVVAAFAIMIWSLARSAARGGQMEERAKQAEAVAREVKRAAERDAETLGRIADADAASVGESAERIRERMRRRDPETR